MCPPRVLIVDDNVVNLAILEELLGEDYDVVSATNGEQAVAKAQQTPPRLVLLDVMMPTIDGYETCRRLRADPALKGMGVIMVSAKAMPAEMQRGLDAGADDYITKPFDLAALRATVDAYFN